MKPQEGMHIVVLSKWSTPSSYALGMMNPKILFCQFSQLFSLKNCYEDTFAVTSRGREGRQVRAQKASIVG